MAVSKPTLHILPSGGFSSEIKALAQAIGYNDFIFYDDNSAVSSHNLNDMPQSGVAAIASGSAEVRKSLLNRVSAHLSFPNLLHPSVILMDPKGLQIGRGCLIAAGSILTTNVHLGNFVLINLQCSIGHDCVLEDFVSLMPGARLSGGVHLEEGVYLGTNAVVLPNIRIGKNAVVGAGAVVTKDVAANTTVVGIPAKPIV